MSSEEDFDKRFVEVWLQAVEGGHQNKWIGEQLRIHTSYVRSKAQTLRKHGVKLPALRGGHYNISPEHVSDLNDLLKGDA